MSDPIKHSLPRADDRSGAGSQHAQFDPSAWAYRPANAGTYTDEGMGPLWPPLIPTLSR
jgi:hypothetical protein